jgi:hypothetical protein
MPILSFKSAQRNMFNESQSSKQSLRGVFENNILDFFFFSSRGFELRASGLVGGRSTTWSHSTSPWIYFQGLVLEP